MQIEKTCQQCGKTFHCPPSHAAKRDYCSRECYIEYRKGKVFVERVVTCERCGTEFMSNAGAARFCSVKCRDQQVEMTCEHCGKFFRAKESSSTRRKFCSKECFGAARTEKSLADKTCPVCGTNFRVRKALGRKYCSPKCAAVVNSQAKPTAPINISSQGYRTVSKNGKTLLEHRLIMEQVLGRKMEPFESVHHKNGDRADNRPENLELWVTPPRYGQRQSDMIEWAITFLQSSGYVVTKQEASSSFNAGAPIAIVSQS